MGIDVDAVRADFPFFHGKGRSATPVTYLDSAATSHKPQVVLDAVATSYSRFNANVHRGSYRLAVQATERYEAARVKVATFIGAGPDEVVFTKNATEALNLIANVLAWADPPYRVGVGDEIIVTDMEHLSNLIPWRMLADRVGATVRHVGVSQDGRLDLAEFVRCLGPRTRVVAMTHVSNVLGTVNPVRAVVDAVAGLRCLVVVDAAQSVPHTRVDVAALGADLVAFTGHKMCGPTGIGVLWGRREVLRGLPAFLGGGEMANPSACGGLTVAEPPHRFEAGTPPIAQAVGLGAAVEYLTQIGMTAIADHEHALTAYTLARLGDVPGLRIIGPTDSVDRAAVVSFVLRDLDADLVSSMLDRHGVAVRGGHHCAPQLVERFAVPSAVRVSLYLYNTTADIDVLVSALRCLSRHGSQA